MLDYYYTPITNNKWTATDCGRLFMDRFRITRLLETALISVISLYSLFYQSSLCIYVCVCCVRCACVDLQKVNDSELFRNMYTMCRCTYSKKPILLMLNIYNWKFVLPVWYVICKMHECDWNINIYFYRVYGHWYNQDVLTEMR